MADEASRLLGRLGRLRDRHGDGSAAGKLVLLRALERRRLARAHQVLRLHETLCFLRAYPDDAALLAQVERMLEGFAARPDLRRHRSALADSGIAGTDLHFQFFWFTAQWLAARWPDRLTIDWEEFENRDRLERMLRLLLPYCESAALDEMRLAPREWLERFKGPHETDATFLVRRFAALRADSFGREMQYEELDPPLRLAAGPGTPSRTRARWRGAPVFFQTRPLDRARPDLRREILRPPLAVRPVPPREAQRLVDLARESMVTRSRDLDTFEHADRDDVRVVDCGEGLQFACMGALPERRALLDAIYAFLTLKNGVPIGYVLVSALFGSAGVAYNVFETFRGGESAAIYGRLLGTTRYLFGCDSFSVDPYQLGHGNEEGQESGAWWFYYKLGFRPRDAGVRRLVRAELARLRRDRAHRSSPATLDRLASKHVFLHLRRERHDVLGRLSLGRVSLAISRHVARRFGADREAALRTCSSEAGRLLGLQSLGRFSPGERLAWERWAPLVRILPGVASWSAEEKQALVRIVRAKGGRRESDFVRLFDAHLRLRRAVANLARDD